MDKSLRGKLLLCSHGSPSHSEVFGGGGLVCLLCLKRVMLDSLKKSNESKSVQNMSRD